MKKTLVIVTSIAIAFAACKKDDNKTTTPTPATAKVMFVNGAAATGNVDVKLNDANLDAAQNILFTKGTGYQNITPGNSQKIAFFDDNGLDLGSGNYNFTADVYYSIFAAGSIQTKDIVYAQDDLTAPASGKSKIRFINLSNSGLDIDFYVGSSMLDSNISFKENTGFKEVTASTYKLTANDPSNVPNSPDDTSGVVFADGKIYTVILTGLTTGTGNNIVKMSVMQNN